MEKKSKSPTANEKNSSTAYRDIPEKNSSRDKLTDPKVNKTEPKKVPDKQANEQLPEKGTDEWPSVSWP